jgi:hypothetical protein
MAGARKLKSGAKAHDFTQEERAKGRTHPPRSCENGARPPTEGASPECGGMGLPVPAAEDRLPFRKRSVYPSSRAASKLRTVWQNSRLASRLRSANWSPPWSVGSSPSWAVTISSMK